MTQPKKNLLEAFRSAGASPETPAAAPRVEPRAPVPATPPPAASAPLAVPQPPRWLFSVVGLALAFAFGFLTGRLGSDEARAEGDEVVEQAAPERTNAPRERRVTPLPAATGALPAPQESAPPARLEESSLFDASNTHTIIVATYERQAEDLAWATYHHLLDAHLPAFPPVVSGKHLVVLVGAAASYSELESEERAVQALQRDGQRPYFGAYRVRIDSILSRSK